MNYSVIPVFILRGCLDYTDHIFEVKVVETQLQLCKQSAWCRGSFRRCHFKRYNKHFDTFMFDQDLGKMFFTVETSLQNRFNLAVVYASVYASFQICFVPFPKPLAISCASQPEQLPLLISSHCSCDCQTIAAIDSFSNFWGFFWLPPYG